MNPWTPERISELKAMWKSGKTGGYIAKALCISRNAVMGKCRRLGLLGDLPSKEKLRRRGSGVKASWNSGNRKPRPRHSKETREKMKRAQAERRRRESTSN
jgi:hypothetical protein